MTCKVIIDAFDTEEQAIAFIDWFKKRADSNSIKLFTTEGMHTVIWDGVDTQSSTKDKQVFNITVDLDEDFE